MAADLEFSVWTVSSVDNLCGATEPTRRPNG